MSDAMPTPRDRTYSPESRTLTDPRTGARVRQITNHPSIHHHPFYYLPCMDDCCTRLFFVSHRTGRPEVWCELRGSRGSRGQPFTIHFTHSADRIPLLFGNRPSKSPPQPA